LRKPIAQSPRAHRRDRAIQRAIQARRSRRVVVQRLQDFQVPQCRVVQREKVVAAIKRKPRQVRHIAPKMLREIMQDAARRPDCGMALAQPEAVQRRHFEMLAHREQRRLRRERPIVVTAQNWKRRLQLFPHRSIFGGINYFRRAQSFQLGQQRGLVLQLRGHEITGSQVGERQAEGFPDRTNRREKIIPLRREHALVEMRSRRKDLRDLAFDELAGARFLHLVANRHLAARAQQSPDVGVGRVKRHTAHRHHAAFRQRDIQQARRDLRVLEKHLVEVAEAKKQQRVLGQFAFDATILRHHRGELRFSGHAAKTLGGNRFKVEKNLLLSQKTEI
jgi:hypothetical protein